MTLFSDRTSPLPRRAIFLAFAGIALLTAWAAGDVAGGAVRALALVALLGVAAALVHRGRPPQHAAALSIEERHLLAKDSGIAIVAAPGRRLVIGFGPHGVTLVAELAAVAREDAP